MRQRHHFFSKEERVQMIREVTSHLDNIRIEFFEGLLVDFAHEKEATMVVRGLRAVTDFEYELQISQTNRILNGGIDTIFLTTSLEYAYLSSSMVKEVAMYGGDITKFVPEQVVDRIYEKCNRG
jgi:pantetheine-phosphate adenylyltransferase